jgi:murein DD-endopeptidase MepM/ murein hydrolase activator NlpD
VRTNLRLTLVAATLLLCLAIASPASGAMLQVRGANGAHPLIWPTTGRITQQFGCTGYRMEPRRGSCAHFHYGVDIANRGGTPIYAAAAGTITVAGWDPWIRHNPDWMVVIKSANGVKTMYAHLRVRRLPGIHKGAHVRQGQLIGYMGSTGHSTGSHLLWGVFLHGRPVNPLNYVSGALRRS